MELKISVSEMDNSIYEELDGKTIHHQDESKTSTISNLQTYESLIHQHDSAVVYDSLQTKKFKTTKWKCLRHLQSRKIAITVFIFLSVVCFLACVIIIFIQTTKVNREQTVSKEKTGNKNCGYFPNDCENKTILHTPNKYAYRPFILSTHGLFISDKESFSFHVQACNDVHVALLPKDFDIITDESVLYEIVIGGYRNTMSNIRKRKQGQSFVERARKGYLNCTEVRQFNIDWSNGNISVRYIMKNSTVETIMAWLDPAPLTIIDAGISTGFGATGTWTFCANDFKNSTDKDGLVDDFYKSADKDGAIDEIIIGVIGGAALICFLVSCAYRLRLHLEASMDNGEKQINSSRTVCTKKSSPERPSSEGLASYTDLQSQTVIRPYSILNTSTLQTCINIQNDNSKNSNTSKRTSTYKDYENIHDTHVKKDYVNLNKMQCTESLPVYLDLYETNGI
ncbi:uncharacterized protein LOC134725237 isoform X2 [Mytilus trossulus]|uniref:uncharacterized protein LOC134725237 isoform X1 n=1 Tax=Mytilus trossulus TaxID=6551 RepID=UPI003007E052